MIRSRDNARVKRWARLAEDSRFRRKERRALLEGPHLVAGYPGKPIDLLVTEKGLANREIAALVKGREPVLLAENVFNAVVDAENLPGIAAEVEIPDAMPGQGDAVFLEGIQDAGNVGTIIRTAAAFGVGTVYLDRGCADAWSPKVLRAGMGGHFRLAIVEGVPRRPFVCTVVRGGIPLGEATLPSPVCWVFGAEGRGVSAQMLARATLQVTIPMAPGAESINVAAAAAICLAEAFSRRAGGS